MANIVFIGGIHGVGKSHFSNAISKSAGLTTVSAGGLIGKHESKQVANVSANQETLICAIRAELSANQNYLMDGHFCLLTDSYEIEKIQLSVFEQIGLLGLFVLFDDVDVIKKRLKERDSREYSSDLLHRFQRKELEHAQYISEGVGLPLHKVSLANKSDFSHEIETIKGLL